MAKSSKDDTKNWTELPFYRALAEKVLLFGVPKDIIGLNVMIGFLFVVNFHAWKVLFLCVLIHIGCVYLCKTDGQMFDCLRIYTKKKNYYCT